MLNVLDQSLRSTLPELLKDRSKWDSLIVNRRKPHTYRVFTILPDGNRICLHKFNPCDTHEAFDHPHPWPGAFIILQGSYRMKVGFSQDILDKSPKPVAEFDMRKFAAYEITNPMTWHAVIPHEVTYTVMINGQPFDAGTAHSEVRRTGGKDLDKMPENELLEHLEIFSRLVADYGTQVLPYGQETLQNG